MAGAPDLFVPDAERLLVRIAPEVDDGMLQQIAEADYGSRADENLAVLRRMRDTHFVPEPEWVPLEVLELIRWSEPEDPEWGPGGHGPRGHWMRAFASAWLLRMTGERDPHQLISTNETIVALVDSLRVLHAPLWEEAGAFLTWALDRFAPHEEDAYFGIALLWCALQVPATHDDQIVALCEWISRREAEENDGSAWLYTITFSDQRRGTWRGLGAAIAATPPRSKEVTEWITLIGDVLGSQR